MVFHPAAQEVARALNARREPPPPVVPPLARDQLRRFANGIFRHPARRDIAEDLLIIAIRLDVLGFFEARDQLLVLAGCGLSAAEIADSLERRRAGEMGARELIEKARSTTATPMERALSQGTSATGVGLRSRQRALQRARKDRLERDKGEQPERRAPPSRGSTEVRGPVLRPATPSLQPTQEDEPTVPWDKRLNHPGRRTPSGSSGRGGPAGPE